MTFIYFIFKRTRNFFLVSSLNYGVIFSIMKEFTKGKIPVLFYFKIFFLTEERLKKKKVKKKIIIDECEW